MLTEFLKFFSVSSPLESNLTEAETRRRYSRLRWQVFLSATIGYGLFYVCRLSLNVIKKPLVDAGVLSEAELGIIGSGLFVTYAVGKFANGFLADCSNIRRFFAVGLLVSALINLALGFVASFAVFMFLWALNGWAQSMGAAPCVVALSRWFSDRDRGSFLRVLVVEPQHRRGYHLYCHGYDRFLIRMAVGIPRCGFARAAWFCDNRAIHARHSAVVRVAACRHL